MKKKFCLVLATILLGVTVLIVSLIFVFSNKSVIVFNEKYVSSSGEQWMEFFEDGTCGRSADDLYCNYNIEDNIITVNVTQPLYETTLDMRLKLKIVDRKNLEHIDTCFPEFEDTHPDFNCNSEVNNLEKIGQTIMYSMNNK